MTTAGVDELDSGGGSPAGTAIPDTDNDAAEPAVIEVMVCPAAQQLTLTMSRQREYPQSGSTVQT